MDQEEKAQEVPNSEYQDLSGEVQEETPTPSIRDLYFPSKEFLVTPIIILLNILVFGYMVLNGVDWMNPSVQDLLSYGANFRSSTFGEGEYWRLLTSNYLHIGLIHLVVNMFSLLVVGRDLEKAVGRVQLILLYTFTGIIASITSISYTDYVVSAGASGAVFGAFGYYLVLLLSKQVNIHAEERKRLLSSMAAMIGYNLFYGMTQANIDNAAHIGGLVSGALLSGVFILTKKNLQLNILAWLSVALLLIISVWYIPSHLTSNYSNFQKDIEKFGMEEEYALNVLNNVYALQEREMGREILDSSLVIWKKNAELYGGYALESDLPAEIKFYANRLSEYSQLRLHESILIDSLYKGYMNAEIFNEKVQFLERKIEKLLEKDFEN